MTTSLDRGTLAAGVGRTIDVSGLVPASGV